MFNAKRAAEIAGNPETVVIICEGLEYKYSKCLVEKLPWFKNTNIFPFKKKELDDFFQWMMGCENASPKIWAFMFKCSPVDEMFMNVADEFKIPATGIVFKEGSTEIVVEYPKIAKMSEYFKMLYERNYFADYVISEPGIIHIMRYFLNQIDAKNFNFNFNEQHHKTADLFGLLTVCKICKFSDFCVCRFYRCMQCKTLVDGEICKCICKCCAAELGEYKHAVCNDCIKNCKCSEYGCNNHVRQHNNGNYCAVHSCDLVNCLEKRETDKRCEKHLCKTCKKLRTFGNSDYCYNHKCRFDGCKNSKNFGSDRCSQCFYKK